MNRILFISIFIFTATSFSISQQNQDRGDSIRLEAKKFFKGVNKIELVELIPYCSIRKHRIGFLGIRIKHEYFRESTIMLDNSQLDTTHIGNSFELCQDQFEYLFDLLYNSEISSSRSACYNPRHGIIFYNSIGEICGYIEICFECTQMYSFPETPNLGPPESEKFEELKQLFIR